MKKCVITIGRQCGSGGHTIGKTVWGGYSSASSLFTSISLRGDSAV